MRKKLGAIAVLLALTIWIGLLAAMAWAPAHLWMHRGNIPENDHCAIAQLLDGQVTSLMGLTVLLVAFASAVSAIVFAARMAPRLRPATTARASA